MLLGMVDMSSEWCIFCMLRKKQWLENNHKKGDERTIQKIQELVAKKLSGAQRLGVQRTPYWPFIPVENYAIPLLHIMIGVFNDILDYLTDLIDTTIIRKEECELVKEREYEDIDKCIEQLKQAVSLFNASPDRKRRSKLVSQYNSQEKQVKSGVTTPLSVDEIAEYQCLQKKWQEVTKPRDVANDKKKPYKNY